MPSREQQQTPEHSLPRWEMNLSWAELVVAALERKVISPDAPVDSKLVTNYSRSFRTVSGDHIIAWGSQTRNELHQIEDSIWTLSVTPQKFSGSVEGNSTSYRLCISKADIENIDSPYRVTPLGSQIPLSSEATEALLGTVVTMVPMGEAINDLPSQTGVET